MHRSKHSGKGYGVLDSPDEFRCIFASEHVMKRLSIPAFGDFVYRRSVSAFAVSRFACTGGVLAKT